MKLLMLGVACGLMCGLAIPAAAAPPAPAPIERRLHPGEIEASSFLRNDWNKFVENYHPNYVADDDPTTAWVEGAPGSGAGEWLRLHVTALAATTRVRLHVRDGYQKSKALFTANARAQQVTIRLLPSQVEVKARLEDRDGWQDVTIDQPSGPLAAVELRVDAVYEGTKYADLCISDVQIFATSETPDNPALEKSKQKALRDWRAARLAAAAAFKAQAVPLPLAPSYEVSEAQDLEVPDATPADLAALVTDAQHDPVLARDWADALAVAATTIAELDTLPRAQLAPASAARLPAVDGIEVYTAQDADAFAAYAVVDEHELRMPMLGTVAALVVDQLRLVDLKPGRAQTPTAYAAASGRCSGGPAAWVKRMFPVGSDAPPAVRAVVVGTCGRVETREGHEDVRVVELLVYGLDGRLALTLGPGHVDAYRWSRGATPTIASGHALIVADHGGRTIEVTARTPVAAKP